MEEITRNFYRNFYMRTGGYLPSKPMGQPTPDDVEKLYAGYGQ